MKRKIKVGILTFGDGRDFLQKPLSPVNEKFLGELKNRLVREGFDVITGDEVIWRGQDNLQEGDVVYPVSWGEEGPLQLPPAGGEQMQMPSGHEGMPMGGAEQMPMPSGHEGMPIGGSR